MTLTSTTTHALEQATLRIGVELDNGTLVGIVTKTDRLAAEHPKGSVAARVWKLGRMVGQAWGEHSNGDTVIAIIRDGSVVTFMFRRSNQPHDPMAYGVDKVRG
jgi:hypothetical protein